MRRCRDELDHPDLAEAASAEETNRRSMPRWRAPRPPHQARRKGTTPADEYVHRRPVPGVGPCEAGGDLDLDGFGHVRIPMAASESRSLDAELQVHEIGP